LKSDEYSEQRKGLIMWENFREKTNDCIMALNVPVIPKNAENTVIMVEPRKHKDFEYVLRNIMHMCDGHWSLHIFHGKQNEIYVKEICKSWGDIHFHNLKVDDLLPLPMGTSLDDLYKSRSFWNNFKSYKYGLCIQTDTLMMDRGINPFLAFDYDYIGAPWKDKVVGCASAIKVGCGGFSLRKITSMIEIIEKNKYEKNTPEDVFFSKYCKNPAPEHIARYFCSEHISNEFSIGIHRPWMYEQNKKVLKNLEYYLYSNERV